MYIVFPFDPDTCTAALKATIKIKCTWDALTLHVYTCTCTFTFASML